MVDYEDYAALEARCAALAAENAGMNKFIAESCFVQAGEVPSWHQAIDHAPETPATDAFLAEVRASARNDFIGRIEWIIRNECNPDKTETILNELQSFAAQLRKGVQS
ncbi:hypothetical protein HV089_14430 [Citrobacter freundii]|nr:hypothetical protein HV089_14430 [Citrobacter freundii]HEE9942847.1 hypothetical protein [Citrobacter freundii]